MRDTLTKSRSVVEVIKVIYDRCRFIKLSYLDSILTMFIVNQNLGFKISVLMLYVLLGKRKYIVSEDQCD